MVSQTGVGNTPREDVEHRIEDWSARLTKLYATIESWASDADVRIEHGTILQLQEEEMRRARVSPRPVPILTLLKGKKRISFVPSSLWIIGADGRVNVSTNGGQHTLVDMRDNQGEAPDWQIVVRDIRKATRPFTKAVLEDLWAEQ
jgi:hypothetical protein